MGDKDAERKRAACCLESASSASVIIINFNSGDRLARCVRSLSEQTMAPAEIIVVDNTSTDGSIAAARATGALFTLIDAGGNIGFAAANNLAVEVATSEWIAFLNPDAYPEPGWLAAFAAAVERYPEVDAFGSTQLADSNPNRLDGAGDACSVYGFYYRGDFGRLSDKVTRDEECFAPCAAAAFYRRAIFRDIGGFDERFFCYGEDVDLGFRLRLAGGRCVQLADARVRHEGSGVTGRYSAFSIYHGHRNRIWVYYKNMPLTLYIATTPLRLVGHVALAAKAISAGGGRHYARALVDAARGRSAFDADRHRWARRRGSLAVARWLVWSPFRAFGRRGKTLGETGGPPPAHAARRAPSREAR